MGSRRSLSPGQPPAEPASERPEHPTPLSSTAPGHRSTPCWAAHTGGSSAPIFPVAKPPRTTAARSIGKHPGTKLRLSPPPAHHKPARGRHRSWVPVAEEDSLLSLAHMASGKTLHLLVSPSNCPQGRDATTSPGSTAAGSGGKANPGCHALPSPPRPILKIKSSFHLSRAQERRRQKEVCCQYMELSLSEGEKKSGGKWGGNKGRDKTAFLLLVASQLTDSASLVACHIDLKTKPSSQRGERRGFG